MATTAPRVRHGRIKCLLLPSSSRKRGEMRGARGSPRKGYRFSLGWRMEPVISMVPRLRFTSLFSLRCRVGYLDASVVSLFAILVVMREEAFAHRDT